MEVTYAIGEQMLLLAGAAASAREARRALEASVASGRALATFRELVAAQGGDARVVDDPSRLPQARVRRPLRSPRSGYVADVDAMGVALAALRLGAGRARAEDGIDHAAGVDALVKTGEAVRAGQPLCVIHAASASGAEAAARLLRRAIRVGGRAPRRKPLVGALVG
jgi:pyrimidine-nucleoside phosphorylase